jgi:succinoglycan biosynthesis protein ExoO
VAPCVSVIVPAYNTADYLERALDSALAQTMSDLEVVVVDDAFSDNTLQVTRAAAARDSRVLVLHNERNLRFQGAVTAGSRWREASE